MTGGAEYGTPGEVREVGLGFRDRWGEKWDTGTDSEGIPGQVGRKVGALDREGRWGRRVRRLIRCESMKVGGGG